MPPTAPPSNPHAARRERMEDEFASRSHTTGTGRRAEPWGSSCAGGVWHLPPQGADPPAGRAAAAAAPPCAATSMSRSVLSRRLGSNDMPRAVRAASSSGLCIFSIPVRSDAAAGAGAAIPVCAAFTAGSKAVPVSSTKNLELTEKQRSVHA